MKKVFLSLIAIFMVLSLSVVLVKANEATTVALEDGVQIRTDGNNGLRWQATVTNPQEGQTYGFLFAQGDIADLTVETANVINKEVTVLNDNGTFAATMVKFPKAAATQDISVKAYVKVGEEYIYSTNTVVRNLAEVALGALNKNPKGQFVNNVKEYINLNYKTSEINILNEFVISNNLYEYNPKNLKKEFINDWNEKFETNWEDIDGETLRKSAIIGMQSSSVALSSNIYNFFNDEFYGEKWGWLLQYLLKQSDVAVHPKRQINAILSEEGTASDNYGSGLTEFNHLSFSIANFFNMSNKEGGYAAMIFTNLNKYSTLKDFNFSVYKLNPEFVKNNDSIALPNELTGADGYEWAGWKIGEKTYESNAMFEVIEDVTFIPTYSHTLMH